MDSALAVRSDVALTFDQIFEPLRVESVASLLAEHRQERERMERIAAIFSVDSDRSVVSHFLTAAKGRSDGYTPSPDEIFKLAPAVAVLDSSYWSRALATTDVYEAMPQARRDDWNRQIERHETPPFDESTVVATMQRLLDDRKSFFAERVDGIFRALSGNHVTNSPLGFGKRMILEGVYEAFLSSSRAGSIGDLRTVIAKFMGRDAPSRLATDPIIRYCRESCVGQWVDVDGGALRIRVYKKGTAHLEVHPEMAWRLNCVLASIHPHAIASEHRQRPSRQPKEWPLFGRPLPFVVLGLLQAGKLEAPLTAEKARERMYRDTMTESLAKALAHERWRFSFAHGDREKPGYDEVCQVLKSLGAVSVRGDYDFDFDPRSTIKALCASGCLPDVRAHQYYPTPQNIATLVVELAEIGAHHLVLEPSAGQGALADLLPKGRTVCVEVSGLHCEILSAKGHDVEHGDFLAWSDGRFDRVVMNPPFANGRWRAHLEHAASMVVAGGRLVAVLPSSAAGRDALPGWHCSWSEPIEFAGTSITVSILVASKP